MAIKVDFVRTLRDREVLRLAALGRPVSYISAVTQLSEAQVQYRLGRAKVFKLREIRKGTDKHQLLGMIERNPTVRRMTLDRIEQVLGKERVVINGVMQGVVK